ncbi:MAG TPA: hypothetical protein VFC47_13310 [Caulobacteraceae bacterium]|nr:hypothetical protein [Caulobacteraceae bacterium]
MLTFPTTRPQALLNSLSKAIRDDDITTWTEDSEGDFTHKAVQWRSRAWLRPEVVSATSLRFTIIFRENESDRRAVYSFYHGHMIETFINHFPNDFKPNAQATPNASGKDDAI